MAVEILDTPKTTPWQDRLMGWPINEPTPVAQRIAHTVRAEISRIKKYRNTDIRFRTWSDIIDGEHVVMVERLPDAV